MELNQPYFDFRTGGIIINTLVFPDSERGERAYSPEYFAAHSEHVEIEADDRLFFEGR